MKTTRTAKTYRKRSFLPVLADGKVLNDLRNGTLLAPRRIKSFRAPFMTRKEEQEAVACYNEVIEAEQKRAHEALKRVRLYAKINDLAYGHPLLEEIYDYSTEQLTAIVKKLSAEVAKGSR